VRAQVHPVVITGPIEPAGGRCRPGDNASTGATACCDTGTSASAPSGGAGGGHAAC
jgi:hypothetical protein